MIYFVTGGAGFIGSNFIYYMFEKYGDQITIINIDKLTYAGHLVNLDLLDQCLIDNGQYSFEQIDICDIGSVEKIMKKYRPDYVINFAAESHVDRSISAPDLFLKTNILGVQVLLDACLKYGVKRFHQVSTDEVYGTLGDSGYFSESSPLKPRSPYSASKASADMICQAYYETYDIPMTISRCSNNYGPYQLPEKLIPLAISRLLQGESIPLYGDGRNIRDWLYVKDHCSAIDSIIHRGIEGEVYNIGGNSEWRNIDLILKLIDKMKKAFRDTYRFDQPNSDSITYVEDRKGHDYRYAINASKLKNELNWEAKTSFDEGLDHTLNWYIQNQSWIDIVSKG